MSFPRKVADIKISGQPSHSDNLLAFLMFVQETKPAKEGRDVLVKCPHCGKPVQVTENHRYIFGNTTSCDPCTAKKVEDIKLEKMRDHWNKICPKNIRETKTTHPDFNVDAYKRVTDFPFETSFILLGATGSCKTRIACHRAKMALLKGKTVRILFPEDLKDIPRFQTRREYLNELSKPDLVVMDDAFIAGASKESVSDFLKDLIDRRIRDKKTTIITSQVDSEEYKADQNKYHNATGVDGKRLDALARRIKEDFVAINCEDMADEEAEPAQF